MVWIGFIPCLHVYLIMPIVSFPDTFLRQKKVKNAVTITCVQETIYIASQKRESTLLHTYVCTEHIFDSRPFMYNKISLKKLLAHIFTLLLVPFESKLVNYSRQSESLKNVWKRWNHCFRRKMTSISNSSESLKSYCASNNWPIWMLKVPKKA